MELDKNIEQELAGLLANPEKVSVQHKAMLNDLLQEYPYYQPLHLLLAKASQGAEQNNALAKASLYTNGQTLHRFLFEKREINTNFQLNEVPAAIGAELPVVTDEQETFEEISEPFIVLSPEPAVKEEAVADEELLAREVSLEWAEDPADEEAFLAMAEESNPAEEHTEVAVQVPVADEQETFEEISETPQFQTIPPPTVQDIPDEEISEENVFEEIGEVDYDAYRPFRNTVQPEAAQTKSAETENNATWDIEQIEEEDPEETEAGQIADHTEAEKAESMDTAETAHTLPEQTADAENSVAAQKEEFESGQPETLGAETQKNTLEDDFVFESIVSTDFFAFEDNFSTVEEVQQEKPEVPAPPVIEEHDEAAADEVANSTVSNYNDDKLPYTFLWWLAKTRKEHQSSFQPYVAVKKPGSNELQQQYVEHIFHLQSHLTGSEELLDSAEPPKPVSKDFQIIDSFIKNDPQIHPPNAEQIDNENKAKKSAEDQNDLVSETLAGIYIEQMLYDKAIDTYEKLSLKFPEKSRYFADLIQSIEKKI